MMLYCLKSTDMKEPKHISEIIEGMNLFQHEPKVLIVKLLPKQKSRKSRQRLTA